MEFWAALVEPLLLRRPNTGRRRAYDQSDTEDNTDHCCRNKSHHFTPFLVTMLFYLSGWLTVTGFRLLAALAEKIG